MAPFFIMEYRSSPSMKPFESLCFLELGEAPLVKRLFPGQTDFFNTAPRSAWGSEPYPTLGVSQLAEKLLDASKLDAATVKKLRGRIDGD